MLLPTPLPGLAEKQEVQDILKHAFELVNSPRLGESDAGERTRRQQMIVCLLEHCPAHECAQQFDMWGCHQLPSRF